MSIIIGYTPDAAGEAALARGIDEARLRETDVLVLHFVRVGIRNTAPEDIVERRARMAEIADLLLAEGVRGTSELRMVNQERAQAIVDAVEEAGPELLVIGARHGAGSHRPMIGSTFQQVLLRAPCTVLSVPARHERDGEAEDQ